MLHKVKKNFAKSAVAKSNSDVITKLLLKTFKTKSQLWFIEVTYRGSNYSNIPCKKVCSSVSRGPG